MNQLKKFIKFAFVVGCIISASPQLNAQTIISVNFTGGADNVANEYNITGTAGAVPAANWNNFSGSTGSSGNLLDNSGAPSGATLSFTSPSNWGLGATAASITDPNVGLFNNYLDDFSPNGQIIVSSIGSQFTTPGYSVYVYLSNAQSASAAQLVLYPGVGFIDQYATVTAGNPADGFGGSYVEGTNYLVFTGLTGAFFLLGSNDQDPEIAGFQIVAVPEPNLTGLLLFGIGSLFFIRRLRKPTAASLPKNFAEPVPGYIRSRLWPIFPASRRPAGLG